MAPALGTGIGTYLSETMDDDKETIEHDLPLQILQGKLVKTLNENYGQAIYHVPKLFKSVTLKLPCKRMHMFLLERLEYSGTQFNQYCGSH